MATNEAIRSGCRCESDRCKGLLGVEQVTFVWVYWPIPAHGMIPVMEINGRVVGRALASAIRPALREVGFDRFEGRHAWRRDDQRVDLVTFPSMSAYTAEGVGCTSYSFSGASGVYYSILDDGVPVTWPRDYNLSMRGTLGKSIRQPIFRPWGGAAGSIADWQRDRPDVWYVLSDGSNLDDVAEDALHALLSQGLPFIDLMGDPQRAAGYLASEQNREADFGQLGTALLGRLGSPHRVRSIERLTALMPSA